MPLESLLNEQINIHDLTLEQEKMPVSESKRLFNELINSPLYNKEKRLWNYNMSENQDNINEDYFSGDQLLGVLVRGLFDKKTAKEQYMFLKTQPFYTEDNQQWLDEMENNPDNIRFNYRTSVQLLDVLCQSTWDKKVAEEKFQALKEKQFDSATCHWIEGMKPESSSTCNAELQLISFLTEFELGHDPDQIRIDYDKLKDELFDKKYDYFDVGSTKTSLFMTKDQLLDVLVRSKFDRHSASLRYQQLKNSKLYDQEENQWNAYDSEAGLSTDRHSGEQLIGILCEHMFEKKEIISPSVPPLPEQRSY